MYKDDGFAVKNMQKSALYSLGFSQNDTDIYLALLRLKSGTAIQIAEQAGIPKSTVYDTLRQLVGKGLVNMYKTRGRKHFSVNDPSILKETLAQQKATLDSIFPELSALYDKGPSGSKVRLYKGRDGVEVVAEEILGEAKELIGIGSPEELFNELPEFFPSFTKRRKEAGIPFRSIFRDTPKARERQQKDAQDLRESRLVQPPLPFSSLMWMWRNKIAMLSFKDEVVVVVVENVELAQMIRAIFEFLWSKTEK